MNTRQSFSIAQRRAERTAMRERAERRSLLLQIGAMVAFIPALLLATLAVEYVTKLAYGLPIHW